MARATRGVVLAARRVGMELGNRSMCGAPPPPPAPTVATADSEWKSEARRLELLIVDRFSALEERQARSQEQLIKQRGELMEFRSRAGLQMGENISWKVIAWLGTVGITTVAVMQCNDKVEKSAKNVEEARQELRQAKEWAKEREEEKSVAAAAGRGRRTEEVDQEELPC